MNDIPDAPPTSGDDVLDRTLYHKRAFELKQMAYKLNRCSIWHECIIEMKMATNTICHRCNSDKMQIRMFSAENNMDPKPLPAEVQELSIVEQQLICRIASCINIHMLKHAVISANGHRVTFPQEINEPAKICPRIPNELKMIKVRKQGKNQSSKDFRVRRVHFQNALIWLKESSLAYSDIEISQERLSRLPLDGECDDIRNVEFNGNVHHANDLHSSKLTPVRQIVSLTLLFCYQRLR